MRFRVQVCGRRGIRFHSIRFGLLLRWLLRYCLWCVHRLCLSVVVAIESVYTVWWLWSVSAIIMESTPEQTAEGRALVTVLACVLEKLIQANAESGVSHVCSLYVVSTHLVLSVVFFFYCIFVPFQIRSEITLNHWWGSCSCCCKLCSFLCHE